MIRPCDVEGDMIKVVQERIRLRVAELGTSLRQASLRAGLGKDVVRDIMVGRIKSPTAQTMAAIAEALECDVAFLMGTQEYPRISDPTSRDLEAKIPIVGTVNAGVFTEMSGPEPWLSEEDFETIRAPRNTAYPRARCFAFRVSGDSMNNAKPRPILEGDLALCVDVVDAEIGVVDNEIYVVRRTKDGGQSYEWTLKRARVYTNRTELVPESTNPAHKSFVIPKRHDRDEVEEIAVVGLMYGLFAPFGRYT
jgi:SOS-response transcriptional repressor LexA